MSLAGLAPAVIKPAALVLNVFVATIATWSFWRARHFDWSLFWPFVRDLPFRLSPPTCSSKVPKH